MSERKIWKQQEDDILKKVYEVEGVKNWSQIAKIMGQEYKIYGRTGKQCRERYHNHLKDGISKEKWTQEEQQLLVQLHSKYGNRWALISTFIKGRSQNCIKNMLYSKLRKAVRQLNKIIFVYFRKQLKEIKVTFITRLIQFTQKFYKNPDTQTNEQYQIALNIKNFMLMFDYEEDGQLTQEQKIKIKDVAQSITVFKKVNQRFRFKSNSSKVVKTGDKPVLKNKVKLTKFQEIQEESDQSHSDSSSKAKNSDGSMQDQKLQVIIKKQHPVKKEKQDKIVDKEKQKNIIVKLPPRRTFVSYIKQKTGQTKIDSFQSLIEQKKQFQFTDQKKLLQVPDQTRKQFEATEIKKQQQPQAVSRKVLSKFAGRRLDSLESNRSYILVDTQIQKPIFPQSIITLTPTPYHPGHNFNDWANLSNVWRNYPYNTQQ